MRRFLFAFSLLIAIAGPAAWAAFQPPALTGPVVDDAHMLSPSAIRDLSEFLQNLYRSGGTQIQVVTVPTLDGTPIEEAGIKLFDAWKIGRGTRNTGTGVILLIAKAEHRIRIEVGGGREGDLPDVIASRIIREVISPLLKAGQPDQAVINGVRAIVERTDPGFKMEGQPEAQSFSNSDARLLHQILTLAILLMVLFAFFGGGRGGGFWYLGGGGLGGGGFGGGGFGGGGWSGGGGGWSGGGGGGSGGGASGDW